jgi:hypothetical protein
MGSFVRQVDGRCPMIEGRWRFAYPSAASILPSTRRPPMPQATIRDDPPHGPVTLGTHA